jgi:ribosomal protein S18 acetylase RimI-like enzyme
MDYHSSELLRPDRAKITRVIEQLLRNKSSGILLIAREGGKAIGVTVATSLPSTEAGSMLVVQDLFVEPRLRRRGIGRALVTKLLEEARSIGVERIDFEILSTNEAATRFWQSMGFRPTGRTVFTRAIRPAKEDEVKE